MCIFGKSCKHTFSCRKIYSVEEKDVYNFFIVKVTSQNHVPFFGFLKGSEIEFYAFQLEKTLYGLISCVNIAMDMLLEHNNSDSGILKR